MQHSVQQYKKNKFDKIQQYFLKNIFMKWSEKTLVLEQKFILFEIQTYDNKVMSMYSSCETFWYRLADFYANYSKFGTFCGASIGWRNNWYCVY